MSKFTTYVLTTVFGLFGMLGMLRFTEILVFGGGLNAVSLGIGVVGLALAWVCLGEARKK